MNLNRDNHERIADRFMALDLGQEFRDIMLAQWTVDEMAYMPSVVMHPSYTEATGQSPTPDNYGAEDLDGHA